MLNKIERGYYVLDKLNKSGLLHGFSIKRAGNMGIKSQEGKKNLNCFRVLLITLVN